MAEGCDEFLNFLSICDAIHDFKTEYPKVKRSFDVILKGLNCPSIREIDEKYITYTENSLIKDYLGEDDINHLIGKLESNGYDDDIEIFDKPYNIKLLHIQRGGRVIKHLDRMTDINERELIDFFGSETVNILYDAGINVLKNFSEVTKQRLTINQVINREFMNDSASGKSTSEVETIDQLIDTEEDPIVYDKSSMFNTKYKLTLDKLNIGRIKQMDIDFTIKDKGEVLYESQHGSWNSRPSCIDYLEKSKYKADVIYQIKRSGDWLQALSCLDIMREYNGKKGVSDNIILMTFDRVLLIYALFLGLNVLFTNKDHEVIYFKSKITSAAAQQLKLDKERRDYLMGEASEKVVSLLVEIGIIDEAGKLIEAKELTAEQEKIVGVKGWAKLYRLGMVIDEEDRKKMESSVAKENPSIKQLLEEMSKRGISREGMTERSQLEEALGIRPEGSIQAIPQARRVIGKKKEAVPLAQAGPQVPPLAQEPNKFSTENISEVVNIMNEYTRRENRGISNAIAEKQFYIRFIDLLKSRPKLREQLRNYISKGKPQAMEEDTYELIKKALAMEGGSVKSIKLCKDYITELRLSLECFDSEENPDYTYYENTAFIVLSCLNEYRTSANVYEQMQAILFDILPSIEGYIKCKEPEIQQFFGKDDYTADCTSYAARNIALHSLGLRTGKLESLGNRAKHSVKIPPSAVDFYKKIEKHLEKSTFEERKEWILQQLQAYHGFLHSSKPKKSSTRKLSASRKKSSTRKVSAKRALSARGGTRRKSHK